MKIKSVSGLALYVKNLNRTAAFYETLGFEIKKREANHLTAYSNWFWMDFLASGRDERTKSDAGAADRGAGVLIYLSTDDVDKFYKELVAKKLKPASEPKDQPWGNREFTLRDPDGYTLVIFKRK